jgi:hypothetical protein
MSFGEIVKGVKDAKVAVLDGSDAPGSTIDILGIKTLSIAVKSDSDEQRGDDAVLASTQEAKSLDVSLTAAAANAAALGAFTGATVTTSGSTPNRIILYKEPSTPAGRNVQIQAQGTGRDASGSAIRATVLKASVTDGPTWDLGEGQWLEPAISLTGVNKAGFLAEIANYETEVALT